MTGFVLGILTSIVVTCVVVGAAWYFLDRGGS